MPKPIHRLHTHILRKKNGFMMSQNDKCHSLEIAQSENACLRCTRCAFFVFFPQNPCESTGRVVFPCNPGPWEADIGAFPGTCWLVKPAPG